MAQQIIFILLSAVTLIAGVVVVTNRNLFHAALAMMLSFFGVAGLYVLLEVGFLAAAQLLVYIGAISILVIFAIMMTRRMMQTTEVPYNAQWFQGGLISIFLFGLIVLTILPVWDGAEKSNATAAVEGSLMQVGTLLVSPEAYVLPFEVASVLLLAALIGAIVISMPEKK